MPFLAVVVWMFLWHWSRFLVIRVVKKSSWRDLTHYAIGVEVMYPGVDLMLNRIGRLMGKSQSEIDQIRAMVFAAYHGAALAAGFGTAIGKAIRD